MKCDQDMCAGIAKGATIPCPKRSQCLRFIKGINLKSYNLPTWWVVPPTDYKKCPFFVELNKEED